jgi:hypothetical protein
MRWQTTAALAVILLALGVFYYVYEIRLGPGREKAEGRKGRLFTVETADVNELLIERQGEKVHAKREADGWQLLSPVKARADKGTVEDVLTSVVTAKSDREVAATPTPAELADYGLDKPAVDLNLVLKDGKQLSLALGAKSPTGTWVYARESDKPAVHTVGDTLLRDATRPLGDFRDKTIVAFDRKDVTGFEVQTRDDAMTLESADGKWRVTRPVSLTADADLVRDFLDKLQSAKVKEFVAESPASRAPWGLDRPVRVSVHTGKDKSRATRTLLLGRLDEQKKGVYAMREGESSVLLLPDEVWHAVPRTVATARDKTVVDFDRDKVKRIDIESGKGVVTVAKEGDQWRITAPEALPADQVEAGAVLFKLKELKAQAFLSEDGSLIPRLLGKPEVRVTLTQDGVKEPTTVLFAPSTEKRGGKPSAYAGIAGRGPVVLVDAQAIGELSKSVTDLRDRTLVSGLEPKDVKRMRFKSGDKTVLVERTGDAEWKAIEPKKASAKSTKVDDVLYMLRGLRWRGIADPAGKEPARYGVDSPTLEVTLYGADGGEIATVLVGKREHERAWVKTKSAPAIYEVDPKQLGEAPKIPDDLVG